MNCNSSSMCTKWDNYVDSSRQMHDLLTSHTLRSLAALDSFSISYLSTFWPIHKKVYQTLMSQNLTCATYTTHQFPILQLHGPWSWGPTWILPKLCRKSRNGRFMWTWRLWGPEWITWIVTGFSVGWLQLVSGKSQKQTEASSSFCLQGSKEKTTWQFNFFLVKHRKTWRDFGML